MMRKRILASINHKWFARIFFLIAATLLLLFAVFAKPGRYGDGHEYTLIAEAFVNHGSPDIRIGDIAARESQIKRYRSYSFVPQIFEAIKETIFHGGAEYHGIFRSKTGAYYGYHFWAYPAYVAGVEVLIRGVGGNPLSGFQAANALLLLLVIGYCLFASNICLEQRVSLIAAFTLGGPLFYLKWTHPEFFIATFLFLGFVALFRRSFPTAFLCLALPALQVISLWAVFAVIPLFLFLHDGKNAIGSILTLTRKWWAWLCILLPVSSPLFYFILFGKINLISSLYVDISYVSLNHLYLFWFDLDQGVFVGAPWLLPLLVIFLVRVRRLSAGCWKNFCVALAASFCICTPLLAHVNVNAGQAIFSRYALYAVAPLLAWAGFYCRDILPAVWVRCLFLLAAIAYVVAMKGPFALENYLEHKPWTKLVLNGAPELYNPEPLLFGQRTSGNPDWTLTPSAPAVAYRNKRGIIRKILIPIANPEKALEKICIGQIRNLDGTPVDISKAKSAGHGWLYLDGRMICEGINTSRATSLEPRYDAQLATGIDFARKGFPLFVEFAAGIGAYESWGRWTVGSSVVLKIVGPLPKDITVRLTAGAFQTMVGKTISVSLAGVTQELRIDDGERRDYVLSFSLPQPVSEAYLIIRLPEPLASPADMGMSEDPRALGLALTKIELQF